MFFELRVYKFFIHDGRCEKKKRREEDSSVERLLAMRRNAVGGILEVFGRCLQYKKGQNSKKAL